MIVASWKIDGIFKADAEKVANEITSIGEECKPIEVVEYAKNPSTELNKCFEWDDTIAAEKYRISQAGDIIRNLVIVKVSEKKPEKTNVRFFSSTGQSTYKPTHIMYQNQTEYERLLQQALRELEAFRKKYKSISGLEEVFKAIDEVI